MTVKYVYSLPVLKLRSVFMPLTYALERLSMIQRSIFPMPVNGSEAGTQSMTDRLTWSGRCTSSDNQRRCKRECQHRAWRRAFARHRTSRSSLCVVNTLAYIQRSVPLREDWIEVDTYESQIQDTTFCHGPLVECLEERTGAGSTMAEARAGSAVGPTSLMLRIRGSMWESLSVILPLK